MEEYLRKPKTDPVIEHFGIIITKAGEDVTEVEMMITEKCCNYSGNLHGAVYYSLADIVSGHHAHQDGRHHVTQNGSLNLIAAVNEGKVRARGTTVHRGRKTSVIHVEIFDDNERLLADGNYTYFCVERD